MKAKVPAVLTLADDDRETVETLPLFARGGGP